MTVLLLALATVELIDLLGADVGQVAHHTAGVTPGIGDLDARNHLLGMGPLVGLVAKLAF